MIAWISFTFLCFTLGVLLGNQIEKWRLPRLAATMFAVVGIFIPLASPFFVEFPSLFGKPTVVTFAEEGDLVYHPWGLWTLPWKNMEVANVPTDCERLIFYFQNTSTLVEHEGRAYLLEFDGEICLSDPKKFYSDRSKRIQTGRPLGRYEREVRRVLFRVHAHNEDELKRLTLENQCIANHERMYRAPCPQVSNFIVEKSSGLKQLLDENGLVLKHTTHVQSTDLMK